MRIILKKEMSKNSYCTGEADRLAYGHGRNTPSPLTPPLTMTAKQIRDLRAFAAELAAEGNTDAAREVLGLIATQNKTAAA